MSSVNLEFLPWISETLDGVVPGAGPICKYEVEERQTVEQLLARLAAGNPRFQQAVFDVRLHQLNESVCLLLNGQMLDLAAGLKTVLNDGDTVVLLPFIQGG